MVRFKVVRASRLALALSIVLLAAVLGLLAWRLLGNREAPAAHSSASLVEALGEGEAGIEAVLASSDRVGRLPMDPGPGGIEVEILPREMEKVAPKRVLIYHTHTHEAYEQVPEDPYEAIEAWRTADEDHSVVRVGGELARRLEALGLEVVHDTTDHEGSELSTAYTRSLETLERYDEPFDLYIDLHRDAWSQGMEERFVSASGEPCAQVMVLIGNGEGFDEKPDTVKNLAFANALEERINAMEPGLCKPTLIKDGRYNQHIGGIAILIEVGHNRNTLREALNAVPALAEGIHALMVAK